MKFTALFVILVISRLSSSFPRIGYFFREEQDEIALDELIGNDIIYPSGADDNEKRGAAIKSEKWPKVGGAVRIPYTIEGGHDYHETIMKGVIAFNKHLKCGGLVPRTDEKDYIEFAKGDLCQSALGRSGGKQKIEIGGRAWGWFQMASSTNCNQVPIIVHEIMHAVGFSHEQNRPDRDDYIKIHLENTKPGTESQFKKFDNHYKDLLTSYDYRSIMHYGRKYFSKNGKDTIEPIGYNGPLGNNELSPIDVDEINKYFGCYGSTTVIDKSGVEKCSKQKKDCYNYHYWKCLTRFTCPCKANYKRCCNDIYECRTKHGIAKLGCEKGRALCFIEV